MSKIKKNYIEVLLYYVLTVLGSLMLLNSDATTFVKAVFLIWLGFMMVYSLSRDKKNNSR